MRLSFFPLAPAVCPFITQSCSNIEKRDFIVFGSRRGYFSPRKTSPNPSTCGCLIADFS